MNYDRIILELMNRVQKLEEQVAVHDVLMRDINEKGGEFDELQENIDGGYTRKQARDKVISIIQSKFPNYLVTTASRKEGSGIRIQKLDVKFKRPIFIKFYHSKTFIDKTGVEHGWHVTKLSDVVGTNIDYCLYSIVDLNDNWNFFVFESEEIGQYHEEHRSDNADVLHMYFSVRNEFAKEIREGSVDVTHHLNNWSILI